MRYLRLVVICIFVASLGFFAWANLRYYSGLNQDVPTISSDTDLLKISIHDSPDALLQGLTAKDKTDGDLTSKIIVASMSHFIEDNTVYVKYVVFDAHNNSASLTRKVCFTDYQSPRFSLNVPAVMTRGSNFDLLNRLEVIDCIDGDISDQIRVVTNMVNIYSAGVYPVTLEVTNSCGDLEQLTLMVTVLDKENTAAIQLDQYIVYVEQGSTFTPADHIQRVIDSNSLSLPVENVRINGSPDLNTPGTYQLEFTYSDENVAGQTTMTVVVESKEVAS